MAWRHEKWARESARLLAGISRSVCGKPQFRSFFFCCGLSAVLETMNGNLRTKYFGAGHDFKIAIPFSNL